jgi:hypothetical protein
MKLDIRKITNGFVVSIDGVETFCDIPEAICGHVAEWVQERCRNLESKTSYAGADAAMKSQLAQALAQAVSDDPNKAVSSIPPYCTSAGS